jgi:hypothetical protein
MALEGGGGGSSSSRGTSAGQETSIVVVEDLGPGVVIQCCGTPQPLGIHTCHGWDGISPETAAAETNKCNNQWAYFFDQHRSNTYQM